MSYERNVSINKNGFKSLDEALAWLVQQYDKEFASATMVHLEIQQIMVRSDDSSEWSYDWTAGVNGLVEEVLDERP